MLLSNLAPIAATIRRQEGGVGGFGDQRHRLLPARRIMEALGLASGDGRYVRMLKMLARMQRLILDDRGITPLTAEQRRDLPENIDDRHGRASTIVTSQMPVEHWHEHIGQSHHRRRRAGPPVARPTPPRTERRQHTQATRRQGKA